MECLNWPADRVTSHPDELGYTWVFCWQWGLWLWKHAVKDNRGLSCTKTATFHSEGFARSFKNFFLKIQTKLMQQLKHWTLLIHILSFNHVHIFIFIFHSSAEVFHLQLSWMLFSTLLSVSSCLVKCSVLDFSHVWKGTKGRWSQRPEGDVYSLNTHFLRCEASRRRKGEIFHRSSLTGSRRTVAGKKDFESCGTFKYTGPHC